MPVGNLWRKFSPQNVVPAAARCVQNAEVWATSPESLFGAAAMNQRCQRCFSVVITRWGASYCAAGCGELQKALLDAQIAAFRAEAEADQRAAARLFRPSATKSVAHTFAPPRNGTETPKEKPMVQFVITKESTIEEIERALAVVRTAYGQAKVDRAEKAAVAHQLYLEYMAAMPPLPEDATVRQRFHAVGASLEDRSSYYPGVDDRAIEAARQRWLDGKRPFDVANDRFVSLFQLMQQYTHTLASRRAAIEQRQRNEAALRQLVGVA